jgi:acyl dehydratase
LYRPLPTAAEMVTNSKVISVQDRGKTRGAAITMVTEARMKRDDTAIYRAESMLIARGDGGCGGTGDPAAVHHRLPDREPDMACDIRTRADQALLYRLCGDFNPLHADPAVAAAAGFERPILHGLCSYGIACRAVLMTICDYDFTLINGFDARFSAAVFPGETLTTEMWQDRNVVSFRCRAKERNVVVLDNGRCTLAV